MDRIAWGINNTQTHKHLLAEKNLAFGKPKEIALALESAVQDTWYIQTPSIDTVHKVVNGKKSNSYICYWCGKTNHMSSQCQHKDTVCKKCNETAHLANRPLNLEGTTVRP